MKEELIRELSYCNSKFTIGFTPARFRHPSPVPYNSLWGLRRFAPGGEGQTASAVGKGFRF